MAMQQYQRQVAEGGRYPTAYGESHATGQAYGTGVYAATGQLGEEVQKLDQILKRRQDDYDAARTAQAISEYNQSMEHYMNDP